MTIMIKSPIVFVAMLTGVCAFTIAPQSLRLPTFSASPSQLYGIKKRGKLGKTLEGTPSKVRTSPRTSSKKKAASSGKKSQSAEGVSIAPGLSAWIAQTSDDDDNEGKVAKTTTTAAASATPKTSASTVDSTSFERFEEEKAPSKSSSTKGSSRRMKQSERKVVEDERTEKVTAAIEALTKSLEATNNLDGIISSIRSLLALESGNLRQVVSGSRKLNYRLAWVGSDDAICHVGTGLHKVPLARLQEVFMTSLGRSRIEIVEVIRILGPFPNVKNTLQGNTKISTLDGGRINQWQITMDSMVDGTGKEILAGTEENIRRVGLHVYFADENAVVAVVPKDDNEMRTDPLENNGSNVLVFVREKDLDEKLEALRVN